MPREEFGFDHQLVEPGGIMHAPVVQMSKREGGRDAVSAKYWHWLARSLMLLPLLNLILSPLCTMNIMARRTQALQSNEVSSFLAGTSWRTLRMRARWSFTRPIWTSRSRLLEWVAE